MMSKSKVPEKHAIAAQLLYRPVLAVLKHAGPGCPVNNFNSLLCLSGTILINILHYFYLHTK